MKSTGIVRRMDELGRIVVPKEFRRVLRIKEGDEIEISMRDDGEIIVRKYSSLGKLEERANSFVKTLAAIIPQSTVFITDTTEIIATAGKEKDWYVKRRLSNKFLSLLEERKTLTHSSTEYVKIAPEEDMKEFAQLIVPILVNGDIYGTVVVILPQETIPESTTKTTQATTDFLVSCM